MTIEEIISEFLEAQRYVRRRLFEEYAIPLSLTAVEWSFLHRKLLKLHADKPIAQTFRPHGYGLEFKDSHVHVDFDLCKSGRLDGFDAWRLFTFCGDNHIDTEIKDYSAFQDVLNSMVKSGGLEKEDNLYFTATPLLPRNAHDHHESSCHSTPPTTPQQFACKRRKSPAHLALVPFAFGIMGITCYAALQLICATAALFRPETHSFSSYHDSAAIFIVIPLLIASVPVGFIGINLLVFAIRPLRRFFDQEAKQRDGEDFPTAMRGLLKLSKFLIPPCVLISIIAALLGK